MTTGDWRDKFDPFHDDFMFSEGFEMKRGHATLKPGDPEPVVEAQEWMPKPLYYTEKEGDYWQKFEGRRAGRRISVLVLETGDVFDAILGRWRERFDPVKMRDIQKLFEPLEPGLGEDDDAAGSD